MRMKTAQILMECLLEQGVDTVFGYPGGTILNVYDEFELHGYRTNPPYPHRPRAGRLPRRRRLCPRHRKVGVCFATSGPGATNLTTGIATAYYDSSPVVFITCNVSENLIGKDSFQEVDITGISHAHHQVQLSGEGPRRPGRRAAGGLRHRPLRPPWPRARGRH